MNAAHRHSWCAEPAHSSKDADAWLKRGKQQGVAMCDEGVVNESSYFWDVQNHQAIEHKFEQFRSRTVLMRFFEPRSGTASALSIPAFLCTRWLS